MKKLSLSLTLVAIVAMFSLTLCQSCGSTTDDKAAIDKKIKALLAECSNPPKDTSLLNILPPESKDSGYYVVENKDETSPFYAYKVNPSTSKILLGYENDFTTEEDFQALMDIRSGKTSGALDESDVTIDEFPADTKALTFRYSTNKKNFEADKYICYFDQDVLYLNISGKTTELKVVKETTLADDERLYKNDDYEALLKYKITEKGRVTTTTGNIKLSTTMKEIETNIFAEEFLGD